MGVILPHIDFSTTVTGLCWFRGAPDGLLTHQVQHRYPGAVKTFLGLNQIDLETR